MNDNKMIELYGMVKDESLTIEKRANAAREYYRRQGLSFLGTDFAIVHTF